ncbi:MAG TPA: EcsC family protein [Thermoanaerobaculia bacterium]|nr:EcsC family protein [Thermoanaerobaculia bacterium]
MSERSRTMPKPESLKLRADRVLVEVFRSLFEEIDIPKLRREIAAMERSNPEWEPREYALLLTRRTALRCAATGAMTGLPSGMLAVATLGADLAYLVYQQFRLILGIATIYGEEPTAKERFNEALACVAYGSGVGIGKGGMSALLESARSQGAVIADRIGSRFFAERLGRIVPVVGALSGGAVNFFVVRAIARATIRYYEARLDPILADEIWNEGDREHA